MSNGQAAQTGPATGPQALTHKERATAMFDEFSANPCKCGPEIFERHLQAHTQALQQQVAELTDALHISEASRNRRGDFCRRMQRDDKETSRASR